MSKSLLIQNIADNVHQGFKLHCVASNISMNECIKDFMERTACNKEIEDLKEK